MLRLNELVLVIGHDSNIVNVTEWYRAVLQLFILSIPWEPNASKRGKVFIFPHQSSNRQFLFL